MPSTNLFKHLQLSLFHLQLYAAAPGETIVKKTNILVSTTFVSVSMATLSFFFKTGLLIALIISNYKYMAYNK